MPDARLDYGASLTVTIAAAEPEQMYGLEVLVVDEEERPIQKGTPQGTSVGFRLLPPGSYRLSVKGPNVGSQLLPIELKAQETVLLEIDLR